MTGVGGDWSGQLHDDLAQVLRLVEAGELVAATDLFSRFDGALREHAATASAPDREQLLSLQAAHAQVIARMLDVREKLQEAVSQFRHGRRGMDAYAGSTT